MSLAGQAKRWKDRNFEALSLSRSFVRQRVLRLLAAICRENKNNFRSNNREETQQQEERVGEDEIESYTRG